MWIKCKPGETVLLLRDCKGVPWLPPEVQLFAWDMARKLQFDEHKGGLSAGELFGLLGGQLDELADAIMNGTNADVIDEAARVANYAMRIALLFQDTE